MQSKLIRRTSSQLQEKMAANSKTCDAKQHQSISPSGNCMHPGELPWMVDSG
jgi:hypothetical protein